MPSHFLTPFLELDEELCKVSPSQKQGPLSPGLVDAAASGISWKCLGQSEDAAEERERAGAAVMRLFRAFP